MTGVLHKLGQEVAKGIPSMSDYGDLTLLQPDTPYDFVVQHHDTVKRPGRPHYDFRIGDPKLKMYSFAIPKAKFPEEKEKVLAIQTQLHDFSYNKFQGELKSRYGKGFVKRVDEGKAVITKHSPNAMHFLLSSPKGYRRYMLLNTGKPTEFLLVNRTHKDTPAAIGVKPAYKRVTQEQLDEFMDSPGMVQEKLDGAHGILDIDGGARLYSVRPSVTGDPIEHTERAMLTGVELPPDLNGTTLRTEIFLQDRQGNALPFENVSRVLNSRIPNSIELVKNSGWTVRLGLIGIDRYKGIDVRQWDDASKRGLLEEIYRRVPGKKFYLPKSDTEPARKRQMLADILAGNNPMTNEGVIGGGRKVTSTGSKVVYFAGAERGEGSKGGRIFFSNEPGGEIKGSIGSGFSESELHELVRYSGRFSRKPLVVGYKSQFRTGGLRSPVFEGFA